MGSWRLSTVVNESSSSGWCCSSILLVNVSRRCGRHRGGPAHALRIPSSGDTAVAGCRGRGPGHAFKLPPVAARFGTFVSPISLPAWLNSLLTIGAALASIERALRLRHNRFLDTVG
ncbi:hypothetical protein ATP06_0227850 [Amycolatopsis regifaucium]|uniref:Cation-transporting P-type ATPase C-terminal domain-containing protein n=1 Tax=Amycolatopsis regifaucium TaxID=546365 RepID=A0ABX3DLS6_9PSEU|nr:hypothetical protein ATP06_0227850 [Amycolatopsis regifaucium]